MNKEEYNCPIDGCDASFFTEVGLNFHVKNKHEEASKPKPTPKKKAAKVTKVKKEKPPKEEGLTVTEYEKQTKELSAKLWKKRLKATRKSLATVKVGDKLTKAELIKLVGDSEGIPQGDEPAKRFSEGLRKQKFTITSIVEKENDWHIFKAESPTHKVIWKEGPIKNRHHVIVPVIIKK